MRRQPHRPAEPPKSVADRPPTRIDWPLIEGQRLDQPSFHARCKAMCEFTRAELIDGVVGVVFSPGSLGLPHADGLTALSAWLLSHRERAPGLQLLSGVTTILGWRCEGQLDVLLCILPEFGGQSRYEEI